MANERVLIAAAIHRGWLDAQSETPGVALPARLWLLDGANGWLDELDIYHGVIRRVERLDPLPQASFYEMAWDGWQPDEPMTMGCSTPEMAEPEPEPMVYVNEMVSHVCEWAVQRGN